uniref:Uncharacterized protein n=1 Tax=Rhizophora mucronata TaxID=61149 RepID=A0A2P2MWS6_RHIMU
MNMDAFYPSFLASYSIVLLGLAAVLYINPHWREIWFYFVVECINNCFYFIVDNLPMLFKYRAWQSCA